MYSHHLNQQQFQQLLNRLQTLIDEAYAALARQDLQELQRIASEIRSNTLVAGEVLVQVQAQLLEQSIQLQQLHRVANLLEKIKTSLAKITLEPLKIETPRETPLTTATPKVKRIGAYLVEAELLTQTQVYVALADQQVTGMRFGDIVVSRGWLKPGTIEFLMEKVILPDRQRAANQIATPDQTALGSKAVYERETICLEANG